MSTIYILVDQQFSLHISALEVEHQIITNDLENKWTDRYYDLSSTPYLSIPIYTEHRLRGDYHGHHVLTSKISLSNLQDMDSIVQPVAIHLQPFQWNTLLNISVIPIVQWEKCNTLAGLSMQKRK